MSADLYLNGGDYLMAGFDHDLRRAGFAGNSCQVILELSRAIPADTLRERVTTMAANCPRLMFRPGGLLKPRWIKPRRLNRPNVRAHHESPGLREKLLNEPLDPHSGELLRFDLIENDNGRATLVFTWAHALMDAPGAEHLLSCLGRNEPLPASLAPAALNEKKKPLKERLKLAWKYLHHLDRFSKVPPRSLGRRRPDAAPALKFRVEKFSADETAAIRANSAKFCGVLADAQFHALVSLMELHRLHERLGCASPSYVLPVPVGLRRKGNIEPLLSNQVGMLMFQFLPEQLGTTADAVVSLKAQTAQAMRDGLLESGKMLGEMFRFLPLPVYMTILKQGLRGEICSLFYGDTAAVNPRLDTFLDAPVADFAHVAAVTPSPGLGVIYYYFRGELRVTIPWSTQALDESEAAAFAAALRNRLLNP